MSSNVVDAIEKLADRIGRLEKATKAPERDAWKPSEVAQKIGLPYETTLTLIKSGRIGHVMAGKHYLVPDAELQRFLAHGIKPA